MTKIDEIQKLQALRESGAISEAEFQTLKESLFKNGITLEENVQNVRPEIDVNTWCMLIHFSQLLGFIIPVVGLIVPIVLWQMKKDESEVIDAQGKVVLNWIISGLIYLFISFILCFVLIGYPLLFVIMALDLIFPIVGGVKAKEGGNWKYPGSFNFFN